MADTRVPIGYALLLLPNKRVLKSKGLPDFPSHHSNRDHILARWVSYKFQGSIKTVDEAIDIVTSEVADNDRCLKCRIGLCDGSQIIFSRTNPRKHNSLKVTQDYDPQETFLAMTATQAAAERTEKLKELVPLADINGRGYRPKRLGTLSHYHPDRLFLTAPKPYASQVGFSFTPVSLPSFSVRPNYRIPGCKRGMGDYSENASHYRTRQYCEEDFDNVEEINCRNAISPKRLERAGTNVHSGVFLKTTTVKAGGPTAPKCPLQKQFGDIIGMSKKKQDSIIMSKSINNNNNTMGRSAVVGVLNGAGLIAPVVGRRRMGGKTLNVSKTNDGNNNNNNTTSSAHFDDSIPHDVKTDEVEVRDHYSEGIGQCGHDAYTSPQHQEY